MNRPPLPPFSAEAAAQKVRMAEAPPTPVVSWFTGCSNRRGGDRRSCPRENGGVGCDYVKLPMMADYVQLCTVRFASHAYGPLLPRH